MAEPLRLVVVGPGRAGMSLGLAATRVGHTIVGVLGRSDSTSAAGSLGSTVLGWEERLPACDILVLAVRDDSIRDVAARLAPFACEATAAIHLSGLTSVTALDPLFEAGLQVGGFHPLQTMPNPEDGSIALAGASVGVTADPPLDGTLEGLATSIGARPFRLEDAQRPLYHAAAAAAANYVLTVLGMAEEIFDAAGVPFQAARPLVSEVVANAFEIGPRVALTGPIARGDVRTVRAQLAAVEAVDAELATSFKAFGRATARLAGSQDEMRELLE